MSLFTPDQLDALRQRNPCDAVAARWVALRKKGKRFIGPCPLHSGNSQASDSTSFECWNDGWVCAVCSDGGDVIKLVMKREGIDFLAAVKWPDWPGGGIPEVASQPLDPAEAARATAAREQLQREREAGQNTWRERTRGRAWDMWEYGKPFAGSDGERYLALRLGAPAPEGIKLRFDPAARYYVEDRPKWRLVHTGPAILAPIQRDGRFLGLHRTFINLDAPKGKAVIVDSKSGDALNAKTMHGGKKGGHIALYGAAEPDLLIMGEGIEKVAAVWAAHLEAGRDMSRAAAWSAGDLGNLGGKADKAVPHPFLKSEKGRTVRVPGPVPDMAAQAIAIPPSVSRVVLLGDSTSDKFSTECVLARAAARYARPGLEIVAAWSPAGKDFDDLLREAA